MTPANAPSPPKGRGCLFYGCLTVVFLLLLLLVMAVFTVRFVKNKITDYTEASRAPLPKVEMTEREFNELQGRVKSFGQALEAGRAGEPLVLNDRDLNALIANSDPTRQLGDVVHVRLEGDQVKGQVSLPLSGLRWFAQDRYLNGDATFDVSLQNGVLIVTVQEVRVHGKPLPESFMGALRRENLANEAYKDAKSAEVIRKLESLQVRDGKVTIKARSNP